MGDLELVLSVAAGTPPLEAYLESAAYLAHDLGLTAPEVWEALTRQQDSLAKAVRPHLAHYQARERSGRFGGDFTLHAVRLPRVARLAATARQAEALTRLRDRLQDHLFDLEADRLSQAEWVRRVMRDLGQAYEDAYQEGKRAAGDPGRALEPHEKALLNRLLRDERDYLEAFGADIQAGTVRRYPHHERLGFYAAATQEPYWVGFVLGDLSPDREVRWVWGETEEHCTDCKRLVDLGWLPVRQFYLEVIAKGFAPQSGHLECVGINCRCRLEERRKEAAAPPPE